jgi:hypothetical protein
MKTTKNKTVRIRKQSQEMTERNLEVEPQLPLFNMEYHEETKFKENFIYLNLTNKIPLTEQRNQFHEE